MKLNMQMGAAPAAAVVVMLALAPAAPAVAGQHYTAEKDKLLAADGAAGDWFGVTVDIDDTNVLSGAPLDDDKGAESGSAYVDRVIDPDLCPGDYDQDGVTGFQDLISLLAAWGPCAGCPQDMDGDNAVTFQDLLILLAAWGACPKL